MSAHSHKRTLERELEVQDFPKRVVRNPLETVFLRACEAAADQSSEAGYRKMVRSPMRGRYAGFSTDRLIQLLTALDRDVEIVIKRKPRSRRQAKVRVVAA